MVESHEVSEAGHRILNPLSDHKLALLGQMCIDQPRTRHLDLACGKGEMVCQWALRHQTHGVGVDINPLFVANARDRASELGVEAQVRFHQADAATFDPGGEGGFDLVSCVGATWIGGGLEGTLELLCRWVTSAGLVVVGEPFWQEKPDENEEDLLGRPDAFGSLSDTVDRCEAGGCELVEMVIADHDDWDRYQASQWLAVDRWSRMHAGHPDVDRFRESQAQWRRAYLTYGRQRWGWGVFVLRPT